MKTIREYQVSVRKRAKQQGHTDSIADKHGTILTDQVINAHPGQISRGTVLQILREGSDHYQRYEAARARLRRELGWNYLPVETRVSLDFQLKQIAPVPPREVTEEFVERICNIAEKARKDA